MLFFFGVLFDILFLRVEVMKPKVLENNNKDQSVFKA